MEAAMPEWRRMKKMWKRRDRSFAQNNAGGHARGKKSYRENGRKKNRKIR